ncbi:uroporphyrinogen-III synthase [Pelomonas sp. SE-A7]|uniref:uroporphyrinogen-III synthase n=1 Tax=Pelomonas sp. SE-A7 TaxID=3054953 RepID=UPI00259CEF62|nr:uroporphyrinogen-III synthase [Pelomonas sp. SE-A7]MDM4764578.1 uroporphyrinogen-III synthase [Pelomonas sp. SE-A7]
MRLVLTRPRPQCADWLARLAAQGVDAVALPLIAIEPGEDASAASRAWARLPEAALAMFVSPNAVEHFFAARPQQQDWPAATLAVTVGPGSAQALLQAGVPASLLRQPPADSESFDSEHLWPLLKDLDWQGRLALMLRGEGGRDWLAERLQERGARVEAFNIYRRSCPRLNADETQLLEQIGAEPVDHVWLFSSSEAIHNLATLGFRPSPQSLAIATHARIAETASRLGWPRVASARPDAAAVAQAWRSLLSR